MENLNAITLSGKKRKIASALFVISALLAYANIPGMLGSHGIELPAVVLQYYGLMLSILEKVAVFAGIAGWVDPAARTIISKIGK